jgi:catalase-peroxidase
MAWHSAGTYRIADGRGGAGAGQQRFAPLNSWPDNANLDKARRMLWPIKQKYGSKLSWADLMILAGNVALESMGFKTFGFAGGRKPIPGSPRSSTGAGGHLARSDERYSGERELAEPARRGADGPHLRQSGGPERQSRSARGGADIRETFFRMAMNDEETVALIAGGHTFGKTHGAGDAVAGRGRAGRRRDRGPGPRLEEQARHGQRRRRHHRRSEVTWTQTPTQVEQQLLLEPVRLRVGADQEPGRRASVDGQERRAPTRFPTPSTPKKRHAPTMLTSDLALRFDPAYEKISRRFFENPDQFADAFARAWFKLTHRDMGPVARYLGPLSAEGRADLAGPDPGRSTTRWSTMPTRSPRSRPKIARLRPFGFRARLHRLGLGLDLPRLRQARRRQRRPHPPRSAEGLGGQRARPKLASVLADARRRSRPRFHGKAARRCRSPT